MSGTLWYPVPPVCTAYWGEADWAVWASRYGVQRSANGVYEPATLAWSDTHRWVKTGKVNEAGDALYTLRPRAG